MRFNLSIVVATLATFLLSSFASAHATVAQVQSAAVSDPPRRNVDVPDGWTVKDAGGNVVVTTAGGAKCKVYYNHEDRAVVNSQDKIITLPCDPELTDSEGGDKDSTLTVNKGNVKIDKPGHYDVTGPCDITIQGSSAGEYTGNFNNPTTTPGNIDVNGSNGGTYVTNGPWRNS